MGMMATRAGRRDNDLLLLLALLVLVAGGLMSILTAGSAKVVITVLISAVCVPIVLANWRLGPVLILMILPVYSEIRRLLLLMDPVVLNLDPLVLLPDVIACLLLLRMVLDYMRDPEAARARWFPTRAEKILIALFLWSIVGMFFPFNFNVQTRLNGFRVFTLYIGLFWFYRSYWMQWRWVLATCWLTVIGGLISAAYGLYQLLAGFPSWDRIYISESGAQFQTNGNQIKLFGTLQFAGQYSSYMWIVIIICLFTLQLKRAPMFLKLLAALTIPMALVALGNTFVRSSYVALGLAVATMFVAALKSGRFRIAAVAVGAVAAIALQQGAGAAQITQLAGTSVAARAATITPSDVTFSYRAAAFVPAILTAAKYAGLGAGTGASAAARFGEVTVASGAEVEILYTLVEDGFPGAALEIAFWIALLYYGYRLYLRAPDRDSNALGRTALAVIVANIGAGLSGGLLHTPPNNVYFWIMAAWLLGLTTFYARPVAVAPEKAPVRRPGMSLMPAR